MAQGMNKLNEALASLPEVRELLLSLDAGTSPIAVSGLSGVHRAQLAAAVRHKTQRPLLIICADENEANRKGLPRFLLMLALAREKRMKTVMANHFPPLASSILPAYSCSSSSARYRSLIQCISDTPSRIS